MKPIVRSTALAAALAGLLAIPGAHRSEHTGRPHAPPAAPVERTEAGPTHLAYDVRLRSDVVGARWSGRETVSFTNTGSTRLREVYLRLWGNARDGCGLPGKKPPVRVGRVKGGAGTALLVNCTALRVGLARPLPHGGRATLAFDLSITVPDRPERFGREGPYRFLGNALPVLAVRDGAGWHLDPDVGFGESYYTLAADFRVRLDHPTVLRVPATGTAAERPGEPGRTVTTSTARRVRDFAWAAGPFVTATAVSPGGVRVDSFRTAATAASAAQTSLRKATEAVDAFGRRFGRYPYHEIDLVLHDGFDMTPENMEYPGLVLLRPGAAGGATAHELAHQWWYGIVGNDEFAAPWLDEAFAVYADDLLRGDHRPGCLGAVRWPREDAAISNSMGYWARHREGWKAVVYIGGACALHDLERTIGAVAMARLLRSYAAGHWYGVSTTAAFRHAAQAVSGTDLGGFWSRHRIR